MNNQKSHALTGANNQRINKTIKSDNEVTAAWTGGGCHEPKSNVRSEERRVGKECRL